MKPMWIAAADAINAAMKKNAARIQIAHHRFANLDCVKRKMHAKIKN